MLKKKEVQIKNRSDLISREESDSYDSETSEETSEEEYKRLNLEDQIVLAIRSGDFNILEPFLIEENLQRLEEKGGDHFLTEENALPPAEYMKIFKFLLACKQEFKAKSEKKEESTYVLAAAREEEVSVLRFLHQFKVPLSGTSKTIAQEGGPHPISLALRAAEFGQIAVLEFLHQEVQVSLTDTYVFTEKRGISRVSLMTGDRWSFGENKGGITSVARVAARYGQVAVLRLLHQLNMPLAATFKQDFAGGMEDPISVALTAVEYQQLEVLEFLHEIGIPLTEEFSGIVKWRAHVVSVALRAAQSGNVRILEFLHRINVDLSTVSMIRDIPPFRPQNIPTSVALLAARSNHVEVLSFLDSINILDEKSLIDVAFKAAKHGHVNVLEFLHEIAERKNLEDLRFILRGGVIIEFKNRSKTPVSVMFTATQYDNLNVLEFLYNLYKMEVKLSLISMKIDADKTQTPIAVVLLAAKYGRVEILKFLHKVAEEDHLEDLKSMLEGTFEIETENGTKILDPVREQASKYKQDSVLNLLKWIRVNITSSLSQQMASSNQRRETEAPLLNSPDDFDETPIPMAILSGDVILVRKLITEAAAAADGFIGGLNQADYLVFVPALQYAVAHNQPKVVFALLNTTNRDGIKLFDLAIESRWMDVITYVTRIEFSDSQEDAAGLNLMQIKANNALDEEIFPRSSYFRERTPLHYDAGRGYHKTLEFLLNTEEGGQLINAGDFYGETPLMAAAHTGNIACVNVLIRAGADVCIQNKNNNTALDHAVRVNKPKVVLALLNAADRNGVKLCDLAIQEKSDDIINYIMKMNFSDVKGDEKDLAELLAMKALFRTAMIKYTPSSLITRVREFQHNPSNVGSSGPSQAPEGKC